MSKHAKIQPLSPKLQAAAELQAQGVGAGTRNPRVVRQAFIAPKFEVGSIKLKIPTAAAILILEDLDSPLVSRSAEKREGGRARDVWAAFYIASNDIREVHAKVSEGKQQFDLAVTEFAAKVTTGQRMDFAEASRVIGAWIGYAFSTMVTSDDGGTGTAENPPEATSGQEADSAGGPSSGKA